jgi:glucose-1-phosphate adenylyltransferase
MDLLGARPAFDLHDSAWPILTHEPPAPPARILSNHNESRRPGVIADSIVADGCILDPGILERSVLSPNVTVQRGAQVSDCILMEDVVIGERARLRKTIVDKCSIIPPDFTIGYNLDEDVRYFTVTETGLVVVPKDSFLE